MNTLPSEAKSRLKDVFHDPIKRRIQEAFDRLLSAHDEWLAGIVTPARETLRVVLGPELAAEEIPEFDRVVEEVSDTQGVKLALERIREELAADAAEDIVERHVPFATASQLARDRAVERAEAIVYACEDAFPSEMQERCRVKFEAAWRSLCEKLGLEE